MSRVLSLVACFAAVIALPPAAAAAVLDRSAPPIGGSLPAGQPAELEFSGPISIAPDGVLLLDAAGNVVPVGRPEAVADNAVRIPIDDARSGLHTLTWTGTTPDSDVPARGSITFDAGDATTSVLDVAGIGRSAEASALAVALLATSLVALIGTVVIGLVMRRRGSPRSPTATAILLGAAAAVTLAALLGLVATLGQSDDYFAFAASCIAAIGGALLALVATRAVGSRRTMTAVSIAAVVVSAAALAGSAITERPAPVAADAQKQMLLDGGGQVSLTMAPSAVGANTATIGLRDIDASPGDRPVLVLRPLDGRIGPMRVPLLPTDDGAYTADRVLLPFAGRWRSQLEGVSGITDDDPAVLDFDVIPNEEVQSGPGS